MKSVLRGSASAVFCLYICVLSVSAQAPPGYYNAVDSSNAATLRSSLHGVIDDHVRFPYTASSTDTWDVLEQADEDPLDAASIRDVYRNASYLKVGGGNTNYNREHTWPKSYGFPTDNSSNYAYTDCHQLYLCDSGYNSSRSNKPFRYCSNACSEKTTLLNGGTGGGSGAYPGNSNWTGGSFTSGSWEVWMERRGDIARAMFYMDVRYEGGSHGSTGVAEPDLILTNTESLIANSNTGSNMSVAYMGILSVLLQWHQEDPVDAGEVERNDRVQAFQGNRNPFVDHPEWVDCLFNGTCGGGGGDVTAPVAPTGLAATLGLGTVELDWLDNSEPDLAGYHVYRAASSGGAWVRQNVGQVATSAWSDLGVSASTTYFYAVSAVDGAGNESNLSLDVQITTDGGGGPVATDPWINELHYDNSGSDVGEFVEVAGPAGLDLAGWQLMGYNGNGGATYTTVSLTGLLTDQGGCIGARGFAIAGLQNGAPDGLALIDPSGAVIEFISYEGQLTATNGPAVGMTSVDLGVSETSSTAVGTSLQMVGSGADPSAFTWSSGQAATSGLPNAGQVFAGGCVGSGAPLAPTGLNANAGDGEVSLTWSANGEPDLVGYNLYRSTTAGSGHGLVNTGLISGLSYLDTGLTNGVQVHYVLTAVNGTGEESNPSIEVSATPSDTTPPAVPTGLGASAGDGFVDIFWNANSEADLEGYVLSRGTQGGGPHTPVSASPILGTVWNDVTVTNGTTYFYVLQAIDGSGNLSGFSAEIAASPDVVVDVIPPEAPLGLGALLGGAGSVDLDWLDNAEVDLDGYMVYRASGSAGPWVPQNSALVVSSLWTDNGTTAGTAYFYAVTALDLSGNESAFSADVQITTDPGGGPGTVDPWINEMHYDNSGGDTGEFVEVAGPSTLDLAGWQLVFYNGNTGQQYQSSTLSGVLGDQGGCVGTLSFAMQGIQNGAPDGVALVNPAGSVLDFLSYEGSMVATDGPAAGQTSVDMGVGESGVTPAGTSLQLVGVGAGSSAFSWTAGSLETPGLPNNGQVFDGGCGGPTPPLAPAGFSAEAGDSRILLTWLPNTEVDLAGYNLYRSNISGSGHVQTNVGLITAESYLDMDVVNGLTVHYYLTAVNASGQESAGSPEVSITPQDITAPAVPTGLIAVAGNTLVTLGWNANLETDLAGYVLSRSDQSGGPYVPLHAGLTTGTGWSDTTVINGVLYYYVLQAEDTWGNTSAGSAEVSAAPQTNGSGPGQPVVLTHDDFEAGFGNWDSGGEDCKLYTDGRLAWQGFAALNLQDNSGLASSSTLVQPIDVLTPGYSSIEVDFHFMALGMEKGEGFMLQLFDGSNWVTVQTWARGREFENKKWQHETVVILSSFVNFSQNMKLRLRCDASGDDDDVYIDALTVTAQ